MTMKNISIFCITLAFTIISACGGSSDETGQAGSAMRLPIPDEAPTEKIALGGSFEVTAEAPFGASSQATQLTCQSAFGGSPFRAQWFDESSRVGILVTGFPLDDGSGDTRVDNFQLTNLAGSHQQNARLAEAQLNVKKVSQQGASAIYEVTASGKLMDGGGSFTAKGTCRA